jgi:hypothetical protein
LGEAAVVAEVDRRTLERLRKKSEYVERGVGQVLELDEAFATSATATLEQTNCEWHLVDPGPAHFNQPSRAQKVDQEVNEIKLGIVLNFDAPHPASLLNTVIEK